MDMVTLWWNGDGCAMRGEQLTAASVLAGFLSDHPGLRSQGLGLFTLGNVELEPAAGVRHGEELILRPRVVR